MAAVGADLDSMVAAPSRGRVFWIRFVDNVARRKWWFVLPVLMVGGLGARQIQQSTPVYESTAVLSAAWNPLVTAPDIRGVTTEYEDVAADTAGRALYERVLTDRFMRDVAERAGFGDAGGDTFLLQLIRGSLYIRSDGDRLVTVSAAWNDPVVAQAITDATVSEFGEYLAETVANDNLQAAEFHRLVAEDARAAVDAAQAEYDAYRATLPDLILDDVSSTAERAQLRRLADELERAANELAEAQASVDASVIAARQAQVQATRAIQVIDEPTLPTQPLGGLRSDVVVLIGFVVLGILIAIGAALVTTLLGKSIVCPEQLLAYEGVSRVTVVGDVGGTSAGAGSGGDHGHPSTPPRPAADPDREGVPA